MSFEVTKTFVFPMKNTSGVSLANGSIVINDVFFVKFSIMNGKNGPFVNWPSQKGKDEKWYPHCGFAIDQEAENPYEFKNEIETEIIKEYNKVLSITPKEDTPKPPLVSNPAKNSAVTVKVKDKPKFKRPE